MTKPFGPKHLKAFRDNYLAAFGVAALLLVSVCAQSQIFTKPNNTYGSIANRSSPDSTDYTVTACGVPHDSASLFSVGFGQGQKLKKAAFYYDSCGHHLYVYDPVVKDWYTIKKLNDSTILIGPDTMKITGGGGSFTPPGNDQDILFNDSGVVGADDNLVYNKAFRAACIGCNIASGDASLDGGGSVHGVFYVRSQNGPIAIVGDTATIQATAGTNSKVRLMTNNTERLVINNSGDLLLPSLAAVANDTINNKIQVFNPTTKKTGYTNWLAGGGEAPLTFNNGLTRTSNTIGLGGNFLADTWLGLGSHVFEHVGTNGFSTTRFSLNHSDGISNWTGRVGTDSTYIRVDGDNLETTIGSTFGATSGTKFKSTGTDISMLYFNGSATQGLTISNAGGFYQDTRATPRGLQYSADYSATYNPRSLIDKAYVDAHTAPPTYWPAESQYGLFFQASRFVDTFDFDKHGSISLVKNGDYLDMTNGSVTTPFPNYVTIGEPHLLSDWTIEDTVKLTGALGPATYGQWKPGLHSVNSLGFPIDIFLTLPTTDAGTNHVSLYKGNSLTPLHTSPASVTYSQNDLIAYKIHYNDSVITGTVKNISVGGADSAVAFYNYLSANGAPEFKPNTAQFAFYGIGATGTEQLRGLSIYSNEVKNANILCFGPSRTTPYFEDYWAHGWPRLLNNVYPTVVTWGGGADAINDLAPAANYLKRSNPRIVLMSDMLANLRRAGGNVAQGLITYDSLTRVYTDAGFTVFHFNVPEDSTAGHNGIGMTDVDRAIRAKYPTTYIPGVWDSIGQGTNVMASIYQDLTGGSLGVHLNTLGQAKVAQALIASGKLSAGLNRVGQAKNSDYYITASRDKVELSPYTVNLLRKIRTYMTVASSGVTMTSNTTNNISKSTGINTVGDAAITEDGTKVATSLPVEATGYIWSKGSASAFSLSNQTTGGQSWLFTSVNAPYEIRDATNSYNTVFRIDTGNNAPVFLPRTGQSLNVATSSIAAGYNLNVNGPLINTVPGATIYTGPTGGVPSSVLTVSSTTKGVLLPNMTTTQRDAIGSPATSLLIFNTTTGTFQFYTGSVWQDLGGGSSLTLAAVGSSPNANAASYSSGTLTLQPASGSFPGVVTTGSQTIAGVKTFNSLPIVGTASAHDSSANSASTRYVDEAIGRLKSLFDTAVVRTRIITTTNNTPVNVDTLFVGAGSVLYNFTLYAFANSLRTDGTFGTYDSHIEHSMNYNGTALADGFDMRFMDFVSGGISAYSGLAFIVSGNYGILQFTGQTGKTIQTTLKYGFENVNSFAP